MAIDKIIVDVTTGQEGADTVNAIIDAIEANVVSVKELETTTPGGGITLTTPDGLNQPKLTVNNSEELLIDGNPIGGGGIEGTQYIFVSANGTETQNAAELQAAYDEAKTMSPSATNRITIVAAPGRYDFETSVFEMDTAFIDLVSLDGNRSVIFTHPVNTGDRKEGSISIVANNVFVRGIDVEDKAFWLQTANLNLIRIENCKGGTNSFGHNLVTSGTFVDCQSGSFSFGNNSTASGTFIRCRSALQSFARAGTASGLFIDCVDGIQAYGFFGSAASGTFINCEGSGSCFGPNASGTFINCRGGSSLFTPTASGTFINCRAVNDSFGSTTASGTFINCQAGNNSFGGAGTASGTFNYCISGQNSFGKGGTLTGKLFYSRMTTGTFETPTVNGKIVLCVDGNDDIINLTA